MGELDRYEGKSGDCDQLSVGFHWNYRICRHRSDTGDWYGVHEVYYDDGRPVLVTEKPVVPRSETLKGMKQDMEWYYRAASWPVLDFESIGK